MRYNHEHLDFLRENYKRLTRVELTDAFNRRFSVDCTMSAIIGACKRYGIKSGRTGKFKKGGRPWNTGLRGYMGPNSTSFKKGILPHNHRPLYSERVNRDGYVEISVPERNPYTGSRSRFKAKHVWLWEKAHGPVPKGFAVIFRDGDKRNFDSSNLVLVSRSELLSLNLHGYKDAPEELKDSIFALAKMEAKAGFRLRPSRGRNKT